MNTSYAFELDHTSTYLRNRDMHIYYQKLNKIINRKKPILPRLTKYNSYTKDKHFQQPLKFATHSIYEKYVIKRDNILIFNKLSKINNRSCQAINDEAKIQKYLNIKRITREGIRKINEDLLKESNKKIKEHLDRTKPVLNTKKLKNDFLITRNYFYNLRKVKPNQSVGEIFLSKLESDTIDRCFDIHNLNHFRKKNISLDKKILNENKKLLKKLGYDINNKILSNSQDYSYK